MFIIAQVNESIYSHREVENKAVGDAGLYMRNKIISNQNRSRKLVFFRAITKISLSNNSIFHFAHYA